MFEVLNVRMFVPIDSRPENDKNDSLKTELVLKESKYSEEIFSYQKVVVRIAYSTKTLVVQNNYYKNFILKKIY
jgi:hypothetical protein